MGSDRSDEPSDGPRRTLLRRADQLAAAAVLLVALVLMLGLWIYRGGPRGGLIEIESAPPREVEFLVDLNEAGAAEFSLLPGVGPTLAERIVESREKDGPYLRHEDVLRVKGIGPRTFARIRPHLLTIENQAAE